MKTDPFTITKHILLFESTFTYEQLALQLNISSRTIRNQIQSVEKLLDSFDLTLVRKPGFGLKLAGDKADILKCYKYCIKESNNSKIIPAKIRKNIILFLLLTHTAKLTISYLEYTLFITRPSIYNDLKELSAFLEEYEITIEKTRSNGLKLIAGEKRIRKCLLHWSIELIQDDLTKYSSHPEIKNFIQSVFNESNQRNFLVNLIQSMLDEQNLLIAHEEFERLVTLWMISLIRLRKGYGVTLNRDLIKKINHTSFISAFEKNKERIESKFLVKLSETEMIYLISLIESSLLFPYETSIHSSNLSTQVETIVQRFLTVLSEKIEITDEYYFTKQLFPYIEKIVKKSYFDDDLYNPNEKLIQSNFPILFEYAKLINPIYHDLMHQSLSDSAIATITLLLADLQLKHISEITCGYFIQNNIYEEEYNIQLLKNAIPNLKIIMLHSWSEIQQDNLDFAICTQYPENSKIPTVIAPMIFTDEFINLLFPTIKEIIDKKKNGFYKINTL